MNTKEIGAGAFLVTLGNCWNAWYRFVALSLSFHCLVLPFYIPEHFPYIDNFLAAQLEKAISSTSKHKSTLKELNAALGRSIVRSWDKLHAEYYNSVTEISIFQNSDIGTSLFL